MVAEYVKFWQNLECFTGLIKMHLIKIANYLRELSQYGDKPFGINYMHELNQIYRRDGTSQELTWVLRYSSRYPYRNALLAKAKQLQKKQP